MAAKKEKTLNDLFEDGLKDIYYAEKKILVALPKMAKAAESEELAAAFEKHKAETERQVQRLERVFEGLGRKPRGSQVRNLDLLTGIAAHDLYHAGQIQLLKRLAG